MSVLVRRVSRKLHLWISLCIFIPVVIVIGSGLLLQVKKQFDWIQPPSQKSETAMLSLSFDQVLSAVKAVPEAQVNNWQDIDRLDVRPSKGLIKIRSNNQWEIQLDGHSGEVLQVAYRRSDIIEAIHDGSWFFDGANLWLFLPSGILLFVLWVTGLVMLFTTLKSKYRKKQYR